MKKITIFFLITFSIFMYNAQTPAAIQWQKCIGGILTESIFDFQGTLIGNFIGVGQTDSNDGDVSGNHNINVFNNPGAEGFINDAWVFILNNDGIIEWQKCYGGSENDNLQGVCLTDDGGYIAIGRTSSVDGDLTNLSGTGSWLLKISATGTVEWHQFIQINGLTSIEKTSDGGFICAGTTFGGVAGFHGGTCCDWLIVKLSSNGIIEWQKCLGGTNIEELYGSPIQTIDGGFIFVGRTNSNDGDVNGNHGGGDGWVVKLGELGEIQWQRCLGGSGYEQIVGVKQTTDGGFLCIGQTSSIDGDVGQYYGFDDAWLVKLNANGFVQWEQNFGGSANDYFNSIHQNADGSLILVGQTESSDIDLSGQHKGNKDAWVVKTTSNGSILWSKSFGGTKADNFKKVVGNSNGELICQGQTYSNDIDVSGYHGGNSNLYGDVWVVKILECSDNTNSSSTITQTANNSYTLNGQTYTQSGTYTQVIPNANGCDSTITLNLIINNSSLDEVINSAISIYPNPASNQITIAYVGQIQKVEIMDAKGTKVYSSNENKKEIMLPSSMQTGYYMLLVHTQEGVFRKELMVNK
jgi:hypothetical protein